MVCAPNPSRWSWIPIARPFAGRTKIQPRHRVVSLLLLLLLLLLLPHAPRASFNFFGITDLRLHIINDVYVWVREPPTAAAGRSPTAFGRKRRCVARRRSAGVRQEVLVGGDLQVLLPSHCGGRVYPWYFFLPISPIVSWFLVSRLCLGLLKQRCLSSED